MSDPIAKCTTNTDPNSNIDIYIERYCKPWKISEDAINFIKGREKFSPVLYDKDGSIQGNATIGYGHLIHFGKISGAPSEKSFEKGITENQADELPRKDVLESEALVNKRIKVPLHQFEYDALVCFTYNLHHRGERLLDFVNTGDYNRVGDRIRKYATVKGHSVKGLMHRRHREAEMFEAGIYDSSH